MSTLLYRPELMSTNVYVSHCAVYGFNTVSRQEIDIHIKGEHTHGEHTQRSEFTNAML